MLTIDIAFMKSYLVIFPSPLSSYLHFARNFLPFLSSFSIISLTLPIFIFSFYSSTSRALPINFFIFFMKDLAPIFSSPVN